MGSLRPRRPSPALLIALAALFIALGGSAFAIKNNSVRSKDIVDGAVRGADVRPNSIKGKHVNEGSLDFTCRLGTRKLAGLCFEAAAAPAPTRWKDAVAACDAKGGFLPTTSQLVTAARELGNVGTEGDSEWTDSGYEENGNLKAQTVGANGIISYRQQDTLRRYRCVVPIGL